MGVECGEREDIAEGVKEQDILATLSAKNDEKELAIVDDDVNVGSRVRGL